LRIKRGIRFLKFVLLSIIVLILIIIFVIASARFINARKIKITTNNGVQESIMADIGGIKQYLQIRGQDKSNPVVIFLHGGPGSPMTYINYTYQVPLEKDYTFICWDQRGCGRTYFANQNMDVEKQLSKDILLKDLDEIVDYSRKRFNQDKVIIFGHSWGTVIGSQYAQQHPEKVKAYLGVGQDVSGFNGYVLAANEAMKHAKEKNSPEDVSRLTDLADKLSNPSRENGFRIKQAMETQVLTKKYMPYSGKKSDLEQMWMGIASPSFSLQDARWLLMPANLERFAMMQAPLFEEFTNFDMNKLNMKYEVPMYFIAGESDWITPTVTAEQYYKNVDAPDKSMIIIKDAGHSPFIDQPERFQEAVSSLLSRVK
jgi:pimeloyl-ACP methyl ester carboxylesterase